MRLAYLPGAMGSLRATASGSLLSRKQVRVVPLRPGPVSTMFLSLASGTLLTPVRHASFFNMRAMITYPGPGVFVLCTGAISETTGETLPGRVEPAHDGGGYLFDHLRLPGGQVLAPAARRALAVELAFPLHVLGDGLPGLLLHSPGQFLVFDFYPQSGVEALHGPQGVCPELLVEDERLGTLVGVVGLLSPLHVPQVLFGGSAHHGVRLFGGEGFSSRPAAPPLFFLPAALPRGVEGGRHDVPGVADQQDHPALGQSLHQERRPHAAARLFDHQVVLRGEAREGVPGAGQDEVPDGGDPPFTGRGSHDEVSGFRLRLGGVDVELPEQVADPRFLPDLVTLELSHHAAQPGAPATGDAEDPYDVGGVYAQGLEVRDRSRSTRSGRHGGQPAPKGSQPRIPGGRPTPDPTRPLPHP